MALIQLGYWSDALQKQTSANIILPQSAPPYRVMFLLHGLSDDHSIWLRRTSIERYVEGLNLMVVMPDGGRGFYADAVEGYQYATALGIELPALIRQWFPVAEPFAVTGLSMGGYGAVRFALQFPETFGSAVSHSGALGFGHWPAYREDTFGDEFIRVHGENPTDGPNDLFKLAAETSTKPHIRIDCGTEDFLLDSNRAFTKHLNEIGYAHEYEEFPGDHNWEYWDEHVQRAIAFHRAKLGF